MRRNRIILQHRTQKLKPRAAAPVKRLIQPAAPFDWTEFARVQFMLYVYAAEGSPTAWSLKPRLQIGITTTHGFQDTNDVWRTLTPVEAAVYTVEGAWFPDLTEASTLPGLYVVTFDNPPAAMRIDLGESGPNAFTMTGGTDPALQIALVAYVWEH